MHAKNNNRLAGGQSSYTLCCPALCSERLPLQTRDCSPWQFHLKVGPQAGTWNLALWGEGQVPHLCLADKRGSLCPDSEYKRRGFWRSHSLAHPMPCDQTPVDTLMSCPVPTGLLRSTRAVTAHGGRDSTRPTWLRQQRTLGRGTAGPPGPAPVHRSLFCLAL